MFMLFEKLFGMLNVDVALECSLYCSLFVFLLCSLLLGFFVAVGLQPTSVRKNMVEMVGSFGMLAGMLDLNG